MPKKGYVLISPCRDEAEHMEVTVDSVAQQTMPPSLWVVVDDGSKDRTPEILEKARARLPDLRVVTRPDRGRRAVGPGVIDAFYAGYETINLAEFDYLCKLDLDLELPPRYFETLIERMEADPRIGTCSGKPYIRTPDGAMVSEGCGDEMSVGMTKFYRTSCFADIGGFVREVMWDGIDCHRCRMLGWRACSWDEPSLRFVHLRPMGSSDQNIVKGRRRHGFGQYFMGTPFPYMVASAVYRMTMRPYVVGGLAMLDGYVRSALWGKPRYADLEFREFVRRFQYDCLLRGKRKALQDLDERQAKVFAARVGPSTVATEAHAHS